MCVCVNVCLCLCLCLCVERAEGKKETLKVKSTGASISSTQAGECFFSLKMHYMMPYMTVYFKSV